VSEYKLINARRIHSGIFSFFQLSSFIFLGFVFVSGDTEMAAKLLPMLDQGNEAQNNFDQNN